MKMTCSGRSRIRLHASLPKGSPKPPGTGVKKEKNCGLRKWQTLKSREADSKILRVTEFVTVNELASLMNVPVVDVIQVCMNLG
jgi:translation initiation factor IF-2